MPYHVEIKQQQPTPTAVKRLQARPDELSTVIPRTCGEVWAFVRSASLPNPGLMLALYFDDVINIECGVILSQPFAGNRDQRSLRALLQS